jgi:acyl carrier protein
MSANDGWIDFHQLIASSSSCDELAIAIAAVVVPDEHADVIHRPLVELDIDSLFALELFAILEDLAGRELPDLLFESIQSIGDCASWVWQFAVTDPAQASEHD